MKQNLCEMKKLYAILFVIFVLFSHEAYPQKKARIAVIGSSTSYGQFGGLYPRDSGYVPKLESYYRDLGMIDGISNYGMSAKDCYTGMPTGYVPPAGRNQPDPSYNITRAINATPKPDVVIVNYPSNSYEFMSDEEIIFCLDSIKQYANDHGVRCYITTSQPRDDWWTYRDTPNGLCRLREVRDLILNHFGQWAIDFYTDVTGPDCLRKPEFALEDDFIHLNPAGHTILRDKVIEKNILLGIVPLDFTDFTAKQNGEAVSLKWNIRADEQLSYFKVMRSVDGRSFHEVGRVTATALHSYSFNDGSTSSGNAFYRIEAVLAAGYSYFSKTISVHLKERQLHVSSVAVTGNTLTIELESAPTNKLRVTMFNMSGQRVLNAEFRSVSRLIRNDVNTLPSGVYGVVISSGSEVARFKVVKK